MGEGVLKSGKYVLVLTVYFPFLKIFLIKKKNEDGGGNGDFIHIRSE